MNDCTTFDVAAERAILAERVAQMQALLKQNARDPQKPPALLAVTKTIPRIRIDCLPWADLAGIGENRVQEVCQKFPNGVENLPIHLIGRLQINKVADIIERVRMIQSLDSVKLAQEIDRQAQKKGLCMPVLVQVNIGEEPQKGGLPPGDTLESVRAFARLPGLRIEGLMAILPLVEEENVQTLRPLFQRMRSLFETLRMEAVNGVVMCHLSMGMSGDALVAAQEGATMVRMGTAIWGPRTG